MKKETPTRKNPRIKGYDYNSNGAYFITICVKDKRKMLGQIVGRADLGTPQNPPQMRLSKYGLTAQKYAESIEPHYEGVAVDKYVIMPNHVHMLIQIDRDGGAPRSAHPTNALIPTIVAAFKKITNKEYGFSMWQKSYHDHVVRNEAEYLKIWQYIDENPIRWADDKYFVQEA